MGVCFGRGFVGMVEKQNRGHGRPSRRASCQAGLRRATVQIWTGAGTRWYGRVLGGFLYIPVHPPYTGFPVSVARRVQPQRPTT